MNYETKLAAALGSLPTTKAEKIAHDLSSLSVEELEQIASLDGESFIDDAADELLAFEKISMADAWGRELARADFEKDANIIQQVAGGIGKLVGHGTQAAKSVGQAVSGAGKSVRQAATNQIRGAQQAYQKGVRGVAAREAGLARQSALKQAPGDLAVSRQQRRLARANARSAPAAAPAAAAPAAAAPAAAAPAAASSQTPGVLSKGWDKTKQIAGQAADWAKANPLATAGGAAALGIGGGMMLNRPQQKVVTSSVRRLQTALEKLSSGK